MIIFTIDTLQWTAIGDFDPSKLPDRYPYTLRLTDKSTGKTDERCSNNDGCFIEFLKFNNIPSQLQEAWYHALGYERKTPYSRWEKVRSK